MCASVQRQQRGHAALISLYEQHLDACSQLQRELLAAHPHASKYLSDRKTLFRYLKSSQFDPEAAARRVSASLEWRSLQDDTQNQLAQLPDELQQSIALYPETTDLCGRPAALLRLQRVRRVQVGPAGMQDLKSCFMHGFLEPMRGRMSRMEAKEALQVALVVDLQGASYANLELELLPWLLDMLKQHYPSLIGVVYLHNYSWLHSGLWALLKKVLPQSALDKVVFTSSSEPLSTFFVDNDALTALQEGRASGNRRLTSSAGSSESSNSSFHSARSGTVVEEVVAIERPLAMSASQMNARVPLKSVDSSPSKRRPLHPLTLCYLQALSTPARRRKSMDMSPHHPLPPLSFFKRVLLKIFKMAFSSVFARTSKRVKFAPLPGPSSGRPEGGWRLWFHCLCIFLIARSSWMDLVVKAVTDALVDVRLWYSTKDLLSLLIRSRGMVAM